MERSVVEPVSLRERKKARTRAALIEVSQRLFAEQGYSATTLDDICREVEVTPQTLLRYFESKAHLAIAPMVDALEAKEAADPSSPTVRRHVENLRAYQRRTEKDPVLVALATDLERQLRDALAAALARDWGVDAGDLHASLVAAALVAGRVAVWNRWAGDEDAPPGALLDQQLAVIAYVKKRLPRSSAEQLLPDVAR